MHTKARYPSQLALNEHIQVAQGKQKADLVFKNIHFLDVFRGRFIQGDVAIYQKHIVGIQETYEGKEEIDGSGYYLVPGFIDAHVHIESSLMTPRRFEESVLPLGTTTALWDPHEIANVRGREGLAWALEAIANLTMDVFVMLPSCVPSTSGHLQLETSGAELRAEDLQPFVGHPRVLGLAEMMNYPALLAGDDEVLAKLMLLQNYKRDGHCPGLNGRELNAYGTAGIHSCHESTSLEEAAEKLSKGLHTLIREGSCAKNATDLLGLVDDYSSAVISLCSDDRNPADISQQGHIDHIIRLGLAAGLPPAALFRCASYAPAQLYGLQDRGAIAPGFLADLCLLKLQKPDCWQSGFSVTQVFKSGKQVSQAETSSAPSPVLNGRNLNLGEARPEQFYIPTKRALADLSTEVRVIRVIPGQILTSSEQAKVAVGEKGINIDREADILKIAVLERHHHSGRLSCGFVKGFSLKKGALATSINHDSHNVIVVGASEEAMAAAVNCLRSIDGGIVVWESADQQTTLPLPLAGLMTDASPASVADTLARLKEHAKNLGCSLHEPFLQLSFLALPVIGQIKITDRGLVDVTRFELVSAEV